MSAIRSKWLLYAVCGVLLALICSGATLASVPALAQDPKNEKKDDKKDQKKDEEKTLELKPERKIEFSTDEGTWLSLDISPDGRTIVFELLGDIYTLPVDGGQAKLISGGMPFDSQPRFSPDGKWIAFLSDRDGGENVWIMKPDGSDPKQLSKETWADFASPSWTPDSSYVLVSKTTEAFSLRLLRRRFRLGDLNAGASLNVIHPEFTNMLRRWPSWSVLAGSSAWAVTANCRASVITGKCGCWPAAA